MSKGLAVQHFLLTRFSVPFGKWAKAARYLDPGWLENRCRLFERFCLPSVAKQQAEFEWLVIYSPNEWKPFWGRMASYAKNDFFTPIPFTGNVQGDFKEAIRRRLRPDTDYVVTTRLDSDDLLAKDYLQRIQNKVRPREEFISFPLGCIWYEEKVADFVQANNQFLSYVEPAGQVIKAVYHRPHTDPTPLRKLENKEPAWMIVVHGGNLMNRKPRNLRWGSVSMESF